MGQTKGLDKGAPFTDAVVLRKIREAGYTFICRYLCVSTWKRLSAHEAKMISDADIYNVTVYQDSNNSASCFSFKIGVEHATRAMIQAKDVGQPTGTPIYFSVDYDAVGSKTISNVLEYFKGVASVMKGYKIGVYGSYYTCKAVTTNNGNVLYVWQTPAWSQKRVISSYNLFQDKIDIYIPGLESAGKVDTNISYGNGGGWKVKSK